MSPKNNKKTIKQFSIIAAICLSLVSTTVLADDEIPTCPTVKTEGTGVGNGGSNARDQYLAKLRREIGPRITDHGSTATDLANWCDKITSILRRELRRAHLEYSQNRLYISEQILIDALVAAAQSIEVDPTLGGPMTKTLIDRGLLASEALDQAFNACNGFDQISKLNFLFEWVQLVIQVESEFDKPRYIPFRYQYNRCADRCPPEFHLAEFERQLIKYSKKQLEFITTHFTEIANHAGQQVVIPIGNPRVMLVLAELASTSVCNDLSSNLHAYNFACSVRDLELLSQSLKGYNWHGDRSYFRNDAYAIAGVSEEFKRITDELSTFPCSCQHMHTCQLKERGR